MNTYSTHFPPYPSHDSESESRNTLAQAKRRLVFLGLCYLMGIAMILTRIVSLSNADVVEPIVAQSQTNPSAGRADIADRNGRILATNLITKTLYARPNVILDADKAATGLAQIFPDLDAEILLDKFTNGKSSFLWLKYKISPEQSQAVHDLGDPGLLFGTTDMRFYPNGDLAAHVLGGVSFGNLGAHGGELNGIAGVELYFDSRLRNPAQNGQPLRLSIDLGAQAVMRRVLQGGLKTMDAAAGSAILMDIHTGEILSMVSLPDFDANDRSNPIYQKKLRGTSPLFNRAVQGVYELGSTFKSFTIAQQLNAGKVRPETLINTKGPIIFGGHKIRDLHNREPVLSVSDILIKSSNIGTARMAHATGADAQKDFLGALGLLAPSEIELKEAAGARPLSPNRWGEIQTMSVSYGHGIAVSPLHLASAYATLANGGFRVVPTLIRADINADTDANTVDRVRILSEETSQDMRKMLRRVVVDGTATLGNVAGYDVAGKTGTADKVNPKGGYYKERVIANFASVFPAADPRYVLVVVLDEPKITTLGEEQRTAGWTAVPVAAELISRMAPILGLAPISAQDNLLSVSAEPLAQE